MTSFTYASLTRYWEAKVAERDARIAALEADLSAERAAHAETRTGLLALCDAVAPGRADVDFVDRATLTRRLEALHRDTISQMLIALDIKDTGIDGALAACRALAADRDHWKARAEALKRVAAFARHDDDYDPCRSLESVSQPCTCGLDAARKAAGLE